MSNQQCPTVVSSQPVEIEPKKHHRHWWQHMPRRLSFGRNRSNSETSEDHTSPIQSPGATSTENHRERQRRSSETSAFSYESTAEVRERWNRNYNIPAECFVPPWI